MRFFTMLLLSAAAGLVQVAFLPRVRIFDAGPDILLAMTIIAAVKCDTPHALFLGIFTGILKDILGGNSVGVNTIIFPLVAMLIVRLNRVLSFERGLSCAVITCAVVIVADICAWIILSYAHVAVPPAFSRVIFLEALCTAAIAPLLFFTAAVVTR